MSDDGRPPGNGSSEEPREPRFSGRIHFQDPETAVPRNPSLAERRARIAAEKRRQEQERQRREAAERKSRIRRRVMIGSGGTVGVVALVAAMYSAVEYSNESNAVTQVCAKEQDGQIVAQDERYCDEDYVNSQGGYVDHHNGVVFLPLFLGGPPVPQYRYAYTAPGAAPPPVGRAVGGGTVNRPADTTIKTKSGAVVQRGGFGINSKVGGGGS
ncbi:hypothetical protein [Saccharopolyspora rectivirgula]|jgi:hypothetical protein|uniref:Uncharacterized protein n=1 Tax=Saccharopolyspora rectivirgula TaxID=28042 RepID=A0A073AVV3_9PSEU|nr:hypothetical protein [Saccharopolyspora rectivirgula]KEI43520.1 hypothetical protein GU90_14305 [Saccharopolyspora rectivirgula]